MKSSRLFNILLIIFFVIAISFPMITANMKNGMISVSENRILASFPSLMTVEGKLNLQFPKEFEIWLNDNMGFREKLVVANTKLQYEVFGQLTKKDTIIGKNEWLYYVNEDIIKDYQQLNLPSETQLIEWGNSLEKIDKFLENKGIPFIMMLNLDKKTIYPENYPDTILKVGDTSKTDMLINHIINQTDIDFFTPKEALLQAKSEVTVYSPRVDNAHWNKYGAFIGYLELMKHVQKYFPNVNILSFEDYNISTYENEIKVYNAISFKETDYGFNMKNESNSVQSVGLFNDISLINNNVSYRFDNNNKELPKALVIGDSYIYGLLIPELAESFSEFTFIHSDNIDKLEGLVSLTNPDIVIFENVERMFDHTMNIHMNSKEKYTDYEVYSNLPSKGESSMYLDHFSNESVQEQGVLQIDKTKEVVSLNGWALDGINNSTADSMYLHVGDKYYPAIYGTPHEGVSTYFQNSELLNSGFSFTVNAQDLIEAGEFSFIIISQDKSYQYSPVEYKVETK
ncbi:MAG: hypothetical protein NAG76_03955 [Candidatus Pristimantibacillus lignocellulolyticus]|uniref:AlgX/AlgJ SGNH hydrolase-like domain-containing protein n=1 Tax=Candidatus Pristimantibacillus lignocellulolyticus TaxID=2994561 RepID=A0A9J6ZHY3_9BACL|nr:MAG: hypothetical protein NAG76_03955 [Candidatus Pristimantibacillus lignocellulolyticus]